MATRAVAIVKVTVMGLLVAAGMRSLGAIVQDTAMTWPPPQKYDCVLIPDGAPTAKPVSTSVDTVMPVALPAVAAPIVRPERVMVKAVAAGTPATLVEMTICVAVGADENAVINATEAVPAPLFAGVAAVAKNPDG